MAERQRMIDTNSPTHLAAWLQQFMPTHNMDGYRAELIDGKIVISPRLPVAKTAGDTMLRRLLTLVNPVTAWHRHGKQFPVSDRHLTDLCNYQIECFEALGDIKALPPDGEQQYKCYACGSVKIICEDCHNPYEGGLV